MGLVVEVREGWWSRETPAFFHAKEKILHIVYLKTAEHFSTIRKHVI